MPESKTNYSNKAKNVQIDESKIHPIDVKKIQTLDTATYIYLASSINKSCDDDCLTEQSPWGATTLSNIGSRDIAN